MKGNAQKKPSVAQRQALLDHPHLLDYLNPAPNLMKGNAQKKPSVAQRQALPTAVFIPIIIQFAYYSAFITNLIPA
jgi:hypothetical protein